MPAQGNTDASKLCRGHCVKVEHCLQASHKVFDLVQIFGYAL